MKFQHLQLQWEDLPATEAVVLQPVEKAYLKILYIEWAIFYGIAFVVALAAFYLKPGIQQPALMIAVAAILVVAGCLSFFIVKKSFSYKSYAIRERDVLSRNGWLFQQLEAMPIVKIQHCVVKTGPLEKRYKLASLKLFTAGQHSDITLSGLKAEQAEMLKEWILSKSKADA